uniref:Uncharacterized protein n=1 Tax=Avena sativa TaxID=4498 RepID=A0ACD5ZX31_AVESA
MHLHRVLVKVGSLGLELRSFVGEGDVVGTVANIRSTSLPQCAVYWRGALYLQREANFVVRISLSNSKYHVIRPPVGVRVSMHSTRYLDRSENGVYFAALDNYRLRVWILDESFGQMEWILKHDKDLRPVLAPHRQVHGRWMLKDVNYNIYCSHLPKHKKNDVIEEKLEWNSDSEDLDRIVIEGYLSGKNKKAMKKQNLGSGDMDECDLYVEPFLYVPRIKILGFHPYREIVFLGESMEKGLAFHLTTSKVESLGSMYPTNYNHFKESSSTRSSIRYSFTYTPCWLEEVPRNR